MAQIPCIAGDQDHGLIFCQPNGAYYSPDRVGARVKELMVAVGLEGVSLHSLRHTFASELLSKGVPIAELSERLGHADKNITLAIYAHAIPADSRAAAKVWNDALGDVIQTGKKAPVQKMVENGCTEGPETRALVGVRATVAESPRHRSHPRVETRLTVSASGVPPRRCGPWRGQ